MEQTSKLILRSGALLMFTLTVGVFGSINTEMVFILFVLFVSYVGVYFVGQWTIGAAVCGLFITYFNTRFSVFGSLLFLALGAVFVAFRVWARQSRKQLKLNFIPQYFIPQ